MKYIRSFSSISAEDIETVGGKNASLGEMYSGLRIKGVPVPNGFAVVAQAYWEVVKNANILGDLQDLMRNVRINDVVSLQKNASMARNLIVGAELPALLQDEICIAYKELNSEYGQDMSVAVRSSATAEDLPSASFAGQHDSFLNINGEDSLLTAYKKCLASLFTDRAITYRTEKDFDHFKVALSVGVMRMVRSDQASSGVMFTIDTESGFRDVVLINATYGLGESIVQGAVSPDEFYVHKPTFREGRRAVLKKKLGAKEMKIVYEKGNADTKSLSTTKTEQEKFCVTNEEVLKLADFAIKTEDYYSQLAGKFTPMDIEWAKDGVDGQLYLIQARPETVISRSDTNVLEQYYLTESAKLITSGRAAGSKIASGRARVITDLKRLLEFEEGEVLVADTTSPDWGPVLKKAAAVVTNQGGRTCHAAIIAREMGIPAVVGTKQGTRLIKPGEYITVSCAEGETGKVYEGNLDIQVKTVDLSQIEKTRTKLMINLGNPDLAFKYSSLPCDGVGLARMEFIINQYVGVHPMALLHLDQVKNAEVNANIRQQTAMYSTPAEYFLEKLAEGVGMIAAAFYPRPVIVRMSDFKSNEYANLLGGEDFEPHEANPMLGLRGASRYSHPIYREGFKLECQAMQQLRSRFGLENIAIMIPFCRNVKEAKSVIEVMKECDLESGKNGLKIYVMCEIPNNVIQIDRFLEIFDGISIGSNDLTQLVLGVDRDSEIVAFDFDERDPGVLEMIRLAVEGANKKEKYSGICGQAPSDYPDMAEFLIETGIDSISVNPDRLLSMKDIIGKIEREQSQS